MSKNIHACPFQAGTFLKKDLLTSKAFVSLRKHSKTVLLLMYLKCIKPGNSKINKQLHKDTVINNGELILSYKELISLGIPNKSITNSFDEIIEKGFIRVEHLGGGSKKDYNKYSVIEDWRKYGTNEFKARERIKSAKYGFCATKK